MDYRHKIMTWNQAAARRRELAAAGRRLVFTNGCFDLLHPGHLRYLAEARSLGDFLMVGLNSDRSVQAIKGDPPLGPPRPICPEEVRAEMLAGLSMVDAVVIFDQDDPLKLVTTLTPDILVKGGDWSVDRIVGADVVLEHGGEVRSLPLAEGFSTTNLVAHILGSETPRAGSGPASDRGRPGEGPAVASTVLNGGAIGAAKSGSSLGIVLGLAAILILGIFFLAGRQEPVAPSTAEEAPSVEETAETWSSEGDIGIENITFAKNRQSHHFWENAHAGKILVITGMVRNSYHEPRSFIRLRGLLLNAGGTETLADRFVYAGNVLSEEELVTLPVREILDQLAVRGGRDGINMNIEPDREIPFMVVFDKLPADMEQYRIEPVSSAPVD